MPARLLLIAALLLTAACDDGGDFGKAVPFARESLDGRAFVLPRDGDGKVVMLHFWSGAAPGGGALLPALEELWFEQRDRGLLLLAVDVGEDRAASAASIAGRKPGFPVLPDPGSTLARAYGVTTPPVTVLIDREGRVRSRIPAAVPFGAVRSALKSLL